MEVNSLQAETQVTDIKKTTADYLALPDKQEETKTHKTKLLEQEKESYKHNRNYWRQTLHSQRLQIGKHKIRTSNQTIVSSTISLHPTCVATALSPQPPTKTNQHIPTSQ